MQTGQRHNGPLYTVQHQRTGTRWRRTPGCGCTVHNARCALSPVGPVTVTARLLPGPQGQPAVTAPVPPASFTPAPHFAELKTKFRARGRKGRAGPPHVARRRGRPARERQRATPYSWPSAKGKPQLVGFQIFFPLCASSAERGSSLSPFTRPLPHQGAKTAVPSEDYSREPP